MTLLINVRVSINALQNQLSLVRLGPSTNLYTLKCIWILFSKPQVKIQRVSRKTRINPINISGIVENHVRTRTEDLLNTGHLHCALTSCECELHNTSYNISYEKLHKRGFWPYFCVVWVVITADCLNMKDGIEGEDGVESSHHGFVLEEQTRLLYPPMNDRTHGAILLR